MAGISSRTWSRRRGSGEDQASGGRPDLLCLVQEAGQYPTSSRQPCRVLSRGGMPRFHLRKLPFLRQQDRPCVGKHPDCWCLSRRETRVTWPREFTVLMERRNKILLRLRGHRGEA